MYEIFESNLIGDTDMYIVNLEKKKIVFAGHSENELINLKDRLNNNVEVKEEIEQENKNSKLNFISDELAVDIDIELSRAKEKFNSFNSFHEGYAIIKEELEEYWEEVKAWPKAHNHKKMKKELIQTAAMCIRTIQDMSL